MAKRWYLLAKASRNGLRLFFLDPIVGEARARLGRRPGRFWGTE